MRPYFNLLLVKFLGLLLDIQVCAQITKAIHSCFNLARYASIYL
jgi:hypothetical protein